MAREKVGIKSGKKMDFYGDIVPGKYNKKSRKFHIHYESSDAGSSEDLPVAEVVRSLHASS